MLTSNNLTIDARQLSMLPDKKGDLFDLHHPCNVLTSISIQTTTHLVVNELKPCPMAEFYNTYSMLPSVVPTQEERLNLNSRNIMFPSPETNVLILSDLQKVSKSSLNNDLYSSNPGIGINAKLSEYTPSRTGSPGPEMTCLSRLSTAKENTSLITIEPPRNKQGISEYPVPIPVKLTMDGISISYQAPPLPNINHIENKEVLIRKFEFDDEHCCIEHIDNLENHTIVQKDCEKTGKKDSLSSNKSWYIPSDLKMLNSENRLSHRAVSPSCDLHSDVCSNKFNSDSTRNESSKSITNDYRKEGKLYPAHIPNKSREVPIPDYVDISPQIMLDESINVHENLFTSSNSCYSFANDTPQYLPLLSSLTYKTDCEFEDIREEDEGTEGSREEEDDYPSSWDDVDTKMLSSPRVRSQNAWSDVGVPMTNSSFDFFQEKDRLKLMQPPKLSQPNMVSHNKYASDSNINDALIMLEPGLRKMAKDEYYTTTNSSCTTARSSQTDDNGKSDLVAQHMRTSTGNASLTCKVDVNGQEHIYYCIDDTHTVPNHANRFDDDSENFYEVPVEKESNFQCFGNPMSEPLNEDVDYNNSKGNEACNFDRDDSGFYSYIVCCDEDARVKNKIQLKVEQPDNEYLTNNTNLSSNIIDEVWGMKGSRKNFSSYDNKDVINADSPFAYDHITRIPINQSTSGSLSHHEIESDFTKEDFFRECSDPYHPTVTVNGMHFSQGHIAENSKSNDIYHSVSSEDYSLSDFTCENSIASCHGNIGNPISKQQFGMGESDVSEKDLLFKENFASTGQTEDVIKSGFHSSYNEICSQTTDNMTDKFNRQYDLKKTDDSMRVRIDVEYFLLLFYKNIF